MHRIEKKVTNRRAVFRMRQLLETFGGVRDDFDLNMIRAKYFARNYAFCISTIRDFIGIPPFKIKIVYRNNKNKNGCSVWLSIPKKMHLLARERDYARCCITLNIAKSFLDSSLSIETFAYAIAHEMSHVVLHSMAHPLCFSEIATDITAAICGFSRIMCIGKRQERLTRCIKWGYLSDNQIIRVHLIASRLKAMQIAKIKLATSKMALK